MRILTTCAQCTQEGHFLQRSALLNLNDDGIYEYECPYGHKSYNIVQQQKFELLFGNACYAFLDGYYRETVSSLTASLERFYEFFIKINCIKHNIDNETRTSIWNKVSKQSERQFGAFLYLWLMEFKEEPPTLSTTNVQYRNDVIHKGKFPTKEKTMNYGQAVLELLNYYLEQIKDAYKEEISKSVFEHQRTISEKIPQDMPRNFSSQPTYVALNTPIEKEKTFEEFIESAKYWHKQFAAESFKSLI